MKTPKEYKPSPEVQKMTAAMDELKRVTGESHPTIPKPDGAKILEKTLTDLQEEGVLSADSPEPIASYQGLADAMHPEAPLAAQPESEVTDDAPGPLETDANVILKAIRDAGPTGSVMADQSKGTGTAEHAMQLLSRHEQIRFYEMITQELLEDARKLAEITRLLR